MSNFHKKNNGSKPDANQAKPMPIVKYIDRMNDLYGNKDDPHLSKYYPTESRQFTGKQVPSPEYLKAKTDKYGNAESATDRIRDPKFFQNKLKNIQKKEKPKRLTATRSWQIIKQSMDKDELADWYKEHPEDKPVELLPVELDKGLTEMLGDSWELESILGKKY